MINGQNTYFLEKMIKVCTMKDGIILLDADNGLTLQETQQLMKF
jgi:hypothetical protein